MYVCPSICPPLCSLPWVFSRWEQRARSSTMPVHKQLKVPFPLAKNAVVSIVICRQPSAAFSPSTITPVASPSHRSCTHVEFPPQCSPLCLCQCMSCTLEFMLSETGNVALLGVLTLLVNQMRIYWIGFCFLKKQTNNNIPSASLFANISEFVISSSLSFGLCVVQT